MSTRKKIIIATVVITALAAFTSNGAVNALIGFVLVGAIPGTTATVPFWLMVAIWCLTITAVITIYVESTIGFIRSHKHTRKHQAQMPKRRFGQI